MTTNTMKAIVATGYGSPSVFQLQNVNQPTLKPNEVLVKIKNTTVTQADAMMRTGKPYIGRLMLGLFKPKHQIWGTSFSGIVEAVGSEVSTFKPSQRVFGENIESFGAYAEYITVPADGTVMPLPDNISFEDAAGMGDGPVTSLNFLRNVSGGIKPGQKVLINGASGALGTAAVQLAKQFGAEVTGVCSTRNIGLVKSLGADHVVDYTKHDFTQNGKTYDVIYDTVGKRSFKDCKRVLAENGQYLSPVLDLGLLFQMMWTSAFSSKKAKFAATGMLKSPEIKEMLAELIDIIRQGRLKTIIDRQYPLEKVSEAHTYVSAGHKKGNVVIAVR
ncbi:Zn-dependent oxidoreductase, NADPH:quinone reductase [Owenweeksia hongkongensis DSM 17368]|uniref:Zn-dependent oxidoreductase, NADPH:quinone reductase n=1 Tax=Owenweeksia hongkongensis (strain DSM 17368 / CIP 108786 / JCM 12287 / NRRL B-23963 / UST20020801) TaxID=926562 RepID=G8R7Z0_OWEHD|nr:NAD(P)-dependent alcohol dehydrogenase [Owenweeksia hongkongensis]AEV31313.1 Zn-dependent oxidoreductase, NADPH:quinone reductase [Owenweeksia hongkongensis DSM 17368]